jgi:hypothetical protein
MSEVNTGWIPFDSVWVVRGLEHPVSLDPALKEDPAKLKSLIAKVRAIDLALLLEHPETKEKSFYFRDPRNTGWAVAYSLEVFGDEADFLFNFLPDNSLGAMHVKFHTAHAPL